MIVKFRLFENEMFNKLNIGDIVYCSGIITSGARAKFYKDKKYRIFDKLPHYIEDAGQIKLEEVDTSKKIDIWILGSSVIPEYEYNANKYNL